MWTFIQPATEPLLEDSFLAGCGIVLSPLLCPGSVLPLTCRCKRLLSTLFEAPPVRFVGLAFTRFARQVAYFPGFCEGASAGEPTSADAREFAT